MRKNNDTGRKTLTDIIVSNICHGLYEQALVLINDNLKIKCSENSILGLIELKNIILRLRVKCESNVVIGPTNRSKAFPEKFTIEMLDVVQKVLRCRTHYEVLRVSRDATFSEVKRAYKRLALRLHPDKNQVPLAPEAFRKISDAADILTDTQKRIEYNLLNIMNENGYNSRNAHNGDSSGSDSETENDPETTWEEQINSDAHSEFENEEIGHAYKNFFTSYINKGKLRRAYEPANQRIPQPKRFYGVTELIYGILVSVLIFICVTYYLEAPQAYSLEETSSYNVGQFTLRKGIPYYVTKDFAENNNPAYLKAIENEVENVYMFKIKYTCLNEQAKHDKLIARAEKLNDPKLKVLALKMEMPACALLKKLKKSNKIQNKAIP